MRRILAALAGWLPASVLAADPGLIVIYPGHGRPDRFTLSGRVIEDEGVSAPTAQTSRLRNMVDTVKAMESDEIEDALVQVTVGGQSYHARSDDDGGWTLVASGLTTPLSAGRLEVTARLLEDQGHSTPDATGVVYIVDDAPGVAIITDFDDTIAESHVTNRTRMIRHGLTRNGAQVPVVPGAPAAWQAAIAAGAVGVFYVSGGPRNLYPRVSEFLRVNGLPPGPIFMRNLGRKSDAAQSATPGNDALGFKVARIEELLLLYPKLSFILVGDSGERDPEVYATILQRHPARVAAVFIRRVAEAENDTPGRFEGMTVVDDYTAAPDLLARKVVEARAR